MSWWTSMVSLFQKKRYYVKKMLSILLIDYLQICFMEGTCPQWSDWTENPCNCIEKEGVIKPLRKSTRTCEPSYHKTECPGTPLMYEKCDKKCCLAGWKMIDHKCYFSENKKLNFSESVDKCRSMAAKLVEPMSSEENQKLRDNFGQNTFWIGISDMLDQNS